MICWYLDLVCFPCILLFASNVSWNEWQNNVLPFTCQEIARRRLLEGDSIESVQQMVVGDPVGLRAGLSGDGFASSLSECCCLQLVIPRFFQESLKAHLVYYDSGEGWAKEGSSLAFTCSIMSRLP